ncbi:hypothetical protein ABIB40_004176 [Pedobacter sp. UYP30]|uniref:hypothetical protein n=1 Tax=Pedobacter sp. UYP30 TaxID=1756400 RepID=UPI003399C92B
MNSKEKLEENFGLFMFNMSDYLEDLQTKSEQQGYNLNYSLESLEDLEDYFKKNSIDENSDDIESIACYFGEVVRKNIGGRWDCDLEDESDLYYGKPVIIGYTTPHDLMLSPFDSVMIYILRPTKGFFISVIENDLDDQPINLDEFPTEEEPKADGGRWTLLDDDEEK